MIGYIALALFAATIPAANWMIGNIGHCIPSGPCVVPVGFGLSAPSGVLVIGFALVLRDVVQRMLGLQWAVAAILMGGALSWMFAPPALVLASVCAFLLAEFSDLAVYTPLQRRRLWLAVLASGVVGAVIDSSVFLLLAFSSLHFVEGQILGKIYASALAVPVLFAFRAWAHIPKETLK